MPSDEQPTTPRSDELPQELPQGVAEEFAAICSLSDAAFRERSQMLRKQLLSSVTATAVSPSGKGIVLTFPASRATRENLEELVAFESGCCGSLTWRVHNDPLRLSIEGLSEGSKLLEAVRSRQALEPRARPSLGHLVRALGAGLGLALLVCCILPLAAAALVGGTVAAWLGLLDTPWIILPLALAVAFLSWRSSTKRAQAAHCCS